MIEYRLNDDGVLVEVTSNEQSNMIGQEFTSNSIINTEIKLEDVQENLPSKIGVWSKMKNFFFKEINLKDTFFKNISLELTPYEKKVFREVKEFWTQDIRNIKFF